MCDLRLRLVEEGRGDFKILTDTSTGKRPPGRPRCNWEDTVRMDLKSRCRHEELR